MKHQILNRILLTVLSLVLLVLMGATVYGHIAGMEQALADVYGAWWFVALWGVLAVVSVVYMAQRGAWRRPAVALLHGSLLLVLVGALLTHLTSDTGTIHLREGEATNLYVLSDARHPDQATSPVGELPFMLGLERYATLRHAGSDAASDYESQLIVRRQGRAERYVVGMNRVAEVEGYRLYQQSYDSDEGGASLIVVHDPWGLPLTYSGYALLGLSMLWLLFGRRSAWRRHVRAFRGMVPLLMLVVPMVSRGEVRNVIPPSVAETFGRVHVLYQGRVMPAQSMALDYVRQVYRKSRVDGFTAEQVFLGHVVYPESWRLPKNLNAAQHRLVQACQGGRLLRILPSRDGDNVSWACPNDSALPLVSYLATTLRSGDTATARVTIEKLLTYQQRVAGTVLPTPCQARCERWLNHLPSTKTIAIVLLAVGGVLYLLFLVRGLWRRVPAAVRWLMEVLRVAVLAYVASLLALRWVVGGSVPLGSGYETMLFMALAVVSLSYLLTRRLRLLMPVTLLLVGFVLIAANVGTLDPPVSALIPVLNSPLLSVHVVIIMAAYALLAIMALNGMTALLMGLRRENRAMTEYLAALSRVLLTPAVFLLAAGIFVGAVWANVSWGSYWQWDPKETWALITLLVYALPLHTASFPALLRPRVLHGYLLLAFLTVLITYFGVNLLLGGLHSYSGM